jgi:hypothetical protein
MVKGGNYTSYSENANELHQRNAVHYTRRSYPQTTLQDKNHLTITARAAPNTSQLAVNNQAIKEYLSTVPTLE